MIFDYTSVNMLRMGLALGMLAIASVLDIRKREINDILWIVFGSVAVLLIFLSPDPLSTAKLVGISMIIAPIALALWRFGIFGGADALCLIVLAGLAPMISIYNTTVTPLTVLTNAAVLSTVPLFVNLGRNLVAICRKENIFNGIDATKLNKTMALFIGHRAKNPRYSFSIERVEGDLRKLNLGLQHAETAEFCNTPDTWVTQGIPYIIYISFGFVVQLIYGDIILHFIQSF
ncbi:MAG: A24 family peptidase C-terminal domain-containing protein [Nitrosotalea sp.]